MSKPDPSSTPPASPRATTDSPGDGPAAAHLLAQIQQLEDKYRVLFEDNAALILITDPHGVLLDANPRARQFAGLTKDNLAGKTLGHDRLPPALRRLASVLPAARQVADLRHTLELKTDGKETNLEVHTRHIQHDGRPAIQWLIHDRTAQRDLDRARDEQIYMIVHDLRNPLSNVVSSLELLTESLRDPNAMPAPIALVNIALRSSRRISLLIESLMDVTRMEAGQFTLTTTTARLDTLIEHAVDFVKPTAERKHIPLSVSIDPALPPVLIDVNMIERVVVNLLDNACKFVEPGQAVHVSVQRANSEVRISVHDDGPGIAPEDRPRLFKKFSRGSSVSGQTPGTGLGLAFCKLAVEAHGGRIGVESEPGRGTTFTFTLPAE